jgi:prepilin-type N-terminal cleavage/methylation domain-containing protein
MNTNSIITIRKSRGFTLIEIMIVVAIIALLASIAVPNFLRARKRSQASRILEDMRMIDNAVDQYAIEYNRATASTVSWAAVQMYLKKNSILATTQKSVIGGTYASSFTVDGVVGTQSWRGETEPAGSLA